MDSSSSDAQNQNNVSSFNHYSNLDLIDDFFLFLQTNNYSPETIYNYKKDLLHFDNFLKSRQIFIKDMNKRFTMSRSNLQVKISNNHWPLSHFYL